MSDDDLPDIVSGDGDSPETAIKFTPCHLRERIRAERFCICAKYGKPGADWTEELHYTSTWRQSVWAIVLKDGSNRNVYFETEGTIYDE